MRQGKDNQPHGSHHSPNARLRQGPGPVSPAQSDRVPRYAGDLFAPEALRDPFEHYRAIRDLGAQVRLDELDVHALGRFDDVRAALGASDVLVSSQGVGFNHIVNGPKEKLSLLESGGERHRRMRKIVAVPLMPAALATHRTLLKRLISERIAQLVDAGEFDGVAMIAQHLPLEAIAHLVGLPDHTRLKMLEWASAVFNLFGPLERGGMPYPQLQSDLTSLQELTSYLGSLDPQELRPGSWTAHLFAAAAKGTLTLEEAHDSVSSFVVPSLDTTIYAKSSLLHTLGRNPDQWARLRREPDLISSAVREGLRYSSSVRWFSRVASRDYEAGEVRVRAGERVMLLYGAANRDERHYADPDRFDVARNPVDQLAWGQGAHVCVGQHLARLEMQVMLEAMVEQVEVIEVGAPTMSTNQALYGVAALPMRLHSSRRS